MTRCLVPPQKDFTVREALQQQDVERWLGFITFLCEVFGTMRSSTGEPFRVLVCPIYTCLREVRPRSSPGRAGLRARQPGTGTHLSRAGKLPGLCRLESAGSLGPGETRPPDFHASIYQSYVLIDWVYVKGTSPQKEA